MRSDAGNAYVVEAMRSVALDDCAQTRAHLFQVLLDSTLFVPTTADEHAPGEGAVIITMPGRAGPMIPVFTSAASAEGWRPRTDGYGLSEVLGRSVFESARDSVASRVVIDPGSPTWGAVTRPEIEALAAGRLPVEADIDVAKADGPPVEVRVGRPANEPAAGVTEAVVQAVAAHPFANAAWLYLMQRGTDDAELVIGVRFEQGAIGSVDEALHAVAKMAREASEEAKSIVFTVPDTDVARALEEGAGYLIAQ